MPKDKTSCKTLKEMKNKTLSKKSRFPPSEIFLCVLGNGSKSSSRALYMFTDHARYLFNCGEGTQRLAQEHKMKLSKLDDIFITHNSWENLGGLLGLSLTIQDMGVPEINLHGPPDINSWLLRNKAYYTLSYHLLVTKGFNDPFCDDCMEIKKIPIFKTVNPLDSISYSSSSEELNSSDSDDSCVNHKSKKLRLSSSQSVNDVAIAFACKGHSRPGQLLLGKCADFGVPVGPLLGDLKSGKDVTLPSGKIVYSKDVVSPDQVCPFFLVVECPSEEFLDPFVNEKQFQEYQNTVSDSSKTASLVVHFTPSKILRSPKYQEWMERFPSTTSHLILNTDCSSVNSLATHRIQHQLNLLHPGIFSLLQENEDEVNGISDKIENVFLARTLERYYLRPNNGLDRSYSLTFNPEDFVEEAMNAEGFDALLKDLHSKIQVKAKFVNGDLYPEVAFLGTGSSIPSKVRNVSAILIKSSEKEYLLMDCGEGTYGQMLRLYGNQVNDVLLHLSVIFVSHMHADHHLGLIKVLKERENIFKELQKAYKPILLIGPNHLHSWLKKYSRNFEKLHSLFRFVECSSLEHDELFNTHKKNVFNNCPDLLISTVPVVHCPNAHGVIISSDSSKWKLVYSGDTMPCNRLITAGKNCSLLIHEATMEDDLAEEALIKRHSTTSEAIKVGEDMNAKYTILTHFSQRYAKVPLFTENFHALVGCAFDNMKVRPNEMYILPLLIPILNSLFAEMVEDLQVKMQKRHQKAELMKSMAAECLSSENGPVKG
ncbi:zinc phosphodiesterase ELAC protein 2 [Trichonephila inaurata madagascariensis]|uniref:Zinc phosphodiesterase ELAC protein 2 n=1 Tax=Trichonephila inaurata madagascariensis TaxID=2747483 RepID=A0A8X6XTB1_9ARAC|nr:zinc phosphodiesterase ELAC protein 2 [Trichonephila inaurata madagascariensis]